MSDRKRGVAPRDKRSGGDQRRGSDPRPHRGSIPAGGDLPKWIREEVQRVTPKERREPALRLLNEAADAFAAARYPAARAKLEEAKKLSPRTATIRELLGLTLYRMSNWGAALKELRTYRRMAGDTIHMPAEMDCLRGLNRPRDVEKVWHDFGEYGGSRETDNEMRVVYGSYLLDSDRPREAWKVAQPDRIRPTAPEWELRRWFVAARAAAAAGDPDTARKLRDAIAARDPAFPGMDDLRQETGG